MKRTIALLLAVLLLSGCTGNGPASDAQSQDPESCPYSHTTYTNTGFVETGAATYLVWSDLYAAKAADQIYVSPRGSDTFVPLRAKPNCGHNDENCSAACGMALGYYKNRLYTTVNASNSTENMLDVVSVAVDGTDRRVEFSIPWVRKSDGSGTGPSNILFHGGKLLLFFDPEYDAPYEQQISRIQVVDLETGQRTEPFGELLTPGIRVYSIVRMFDRYIYTTIEYRQPDGSLDTWRVRMDILTGQIQKLFAIENDGGWFDGSYVDDRAIYWFVPDEGFYEYDLATGETACKGDPVPEMEYMLRDENWIYGFPTVREKTGKRAMYVLDRAYTLVDTLPLPDYMILKYVDSEKLYFGIWQQYGENLITATADRAAIGTGKLALNIQKEVEFTDPFGLDEGKPETPEADPCFYEESYELADPAANLKELGTFFCVTAYEEAGPYGPEPCGERLLFVPKGESTPVPMCKKPDCDHTGEDCGAFFRTRYWFEEEGHGVSGSGFGIYQDQLYVFAVQPDFTIELYSVDPVTWERRLEKRYPLLEVDFPWKQHFLYGKIMGDTMLLEYGMYRQSDLELVGGYRAVDMATLEEKPEFVPEVGNLDAYFPTAWTGNVAVTEGFQTTSQGGREYTKNRLLEMRLDTGECRWLMESRCKKGELLTIPEGFAMTRDTIYYFLQTGDFHEYDRKTGEDRAYPCPREDTTMARYMDDLILVKCDSWLLDAIHADPDAEQPHDPNRFANSKKELLFLTGDYELLCTVEPPKGMDSYHLLADSEDYCWFPDDTGEGVYAVSKAQIAQGRPEFVRVYG